MSDIIDYFCAFHVISCLNYTVSNL